MSNIVKKGGTDIGQFFKQAGVELPTTSHADLDDNGFGLFFKKRRSKNLAEIEKNAAIAVMERCNAVNSYMSTVIQILTFEDRLAMEKEGIDHQRIMWKKQQEEATYKNEILKSQARSAKADADLTEFELWQRTRGEKNDSPYEDRD